MARRNPNCSCKICGRKMYRRPFQIDIGNIFCSRACAGFSQRIVKKCPVCSREYCGHKNTCSRECANKNRTRSIYDRQNKKNKAAHGWWLKEKLARMSGGICQICGHANYQILQVHHRIHRAAGGTDDIKNLRLLCPNCHAEQHHGVGLFPSPKIAKK